MLSLRRLRLSSTLRLVTIMGDSTHEMVLVYDAKRQVWQNAFSEGRITRLYYLPHVGEHPEVLRIWIAGCDR